MLAVALALDAVLGEPRWLWSRAPHPVVLMGRFLDLLERWLNRGGQRRGKGILTLCLLIGASVAVPVLIAASDYLWPLEVVGAAILLAHRSLIDHVTAVADGLSRSLTDGRTAVAMIVGRDPESLDEHGVARAAIESAAENFSDGVAAPAFWFLLGGFPGIVFYKAVNTADSMIGHRSERYREFGWAAARLDDLLNWVPARLTGFLIAFAGGGAAALRIMVRDAGLHRSPNAGWPEAAMAVSLGVALAGPRRYESGVVDDPYMHPEGRVEATVEDIRGAVHLLWRVWAVMLAGALFVWILG